MIKAEERGESVTFSSTGLSDGLVEPSRNPLEQKGRVF
jgi:hypothetical protein